MALPEVKPMVEAHHLSKRYFVGQYTSRTFQHQLQSWWARKRGKEDPNRPIDAADEDEIWALDDITFEVYPGEAFGIIGRNGAGKSTLLKILSEITTPTSGDAVIRGRIASMLEVGTGFDPEMTGRENIYLNGAILGMSRSEVDAKLDDIIEFSEIRPFIDTPVKRYSSGMYAKLAFSVAAHLDNEIMVMDEVLAVGDVAFREKCIQSMKTKAEDGRTVLYVGHTMSYVRQLCDRCMVLDEGKCIYIGETEEAVQYYLDNIEKKQIKEQRAKEDAMAQAHADARKKHIWLEPTRDVTDKERSKLLTQHKMHLCEIAYIDKSSIVFAQGELACMWYRWDVLEDYEDLCMRLEVYTSGDDHLASYPLYDIGDGKAGESKELTIEVDISFFSPGLYKFKQSFFFRDEEEGVVDTDRVIGLSFEKDPWDEEYWAPKKMTQIRLDDHVRVIG